MKKLTFRISPCPNDTFSFHAMLHGLVDTEGLEFEVEFADIDQLNSLALSGSADIIKISYAALPDVLPQYRLLRSGGAMGFGNAPIIVARQDHESLGTGSDGSSAMKTLKTSQIAIPGLKTTAAALLRRLVQPNPENLRVHLFSHIADRVADGAADAGVLIHEGRFTYVDRGLTLVADLGQLWEQKYGKIPVPLGAIVARRELGDELFRTIDRVIRRSVEYALANPMASSDFVMCHAAELDPLVRQKHISYFVNEYSPDFGEDGELAIRALLGDGVDFLD